MATGMISPFDPRDERRLKKASYEGCIGKYAYWYSTKGKLVCKEVYGALRVPANSIVFVECDIDFRLPDFIALRFNLQIRHVHRGLLLGTGPLVDPGYWGKLCIPLHNLTNEDYLIPKNEGLIWIEFTKTSGSHGVGRNTLDVTGPDKGWWDIRKFIEKAARPLVNTGETAAIQSSIPFVAESARSEAKKAKLDAEKAARTARSMKNISFIAIIAVAVAIIALGYAAYSNIQSAYNAVLPQANSAREEAIRHSKDIEHMESEMERMSIQIRNLIDKNNRLVEEMRMLRENMQTDPDANVGDHYPSNTNTSAGDHE